MRRLRSAQVARKAKRTRPTSTEAVITPTESALFCKNPFLLAVSATAVAEAVTEDEELDESEEAVAVSEGSDVLVASV